MARGRCLVEQKVPEQLEQVAVPSFAPAPVLKGHTKHRSTCMSETKKQHCYGQQHRAARRRSGLTCRRSKLTGTLRQGDSSKAAGTCRQ
eukprot:500976-Pelagomonas_calceolata.AAC.1